MQPNHWLLHLGGSSAICSLGLSPSINVFYNSWFWISVSVFTNSNPTETSSGFGCYSKLEENNTILCQISGEVETFLVVWRQWFRQLAISIKISSRCLDGLHSIQPVDLTFPTRDSPPATVFISWSDLLDSFSNHCLRASVRHTQTP